MNKTLLCTALVSGLGLLALAPGAARAADGTINITGNVSATTCTITNAASGGTIAVALPTVSTAALNAAGTVAGRTPFNIALSGCGTLTKATTYFEPGPNVLPNGHLKNNGAAGGVDIQLLNAADNSPIVLNGATTTAQNSQTATISGGTGSLNYLAQYYATAAATAGNVASSVQFTISYQ